MPYKDPERQRQAQAESQKRRYHASPALREYQRQWLRDYRAREAVEDVRYINRRRDSQRQAQLSGYSGQLKIQRG